MIADAVYASTNHRRWNHNITRITIIVDILVCHSGIESVIGIDVVNAIHFCMFHPPREHRNCKKQQRSENSLKM